MKEIRRMTSDDLSDVLVNERRGYTHPWSEGIFEDCMSHGNECWLLVTSGRIIGHGILSVGAGEAHLLNLCIHPDCHGHGFGRFMVEHLVERAHHREVQTIFLEVRPSNIAACKLYENMGFNKVGVRENYYPTYIGREDAHVLSLQLS